MIRRISELVVLGPLAIGCVGGPVVAAQDAVHVSPCLAYEPVVVELIGKLTSKTYPGPPGYGESPTQDRPEKVILLTLVKPICTSGDSASDLNSESVSSIQTLQVGPRATSWKLLERFVGHKVIVKGTLFNAHTGHHRTKVLMAISTVRDTV
jgi:hypothetical protein